jgi:hypothetical protein
MRPDLFGWMKSRAINTIIIRIARDIPRIILQAVFVFVVAVFVVAAPAPAGGGVEGKVNRIFQKLDVNRDECLSPEEVQGHWMESKFERADADGNGTITRQELLEFKSGWHRNKAQIKSTRIIEKLDADGDGRVSRE